MNNTTAVFLINDKVRAVYGTYEAGDNAGKTLFKTFDQDLKVGNFAIVPTNTRHNMTVVKITDTDVEFDIDTQVKMEWVIGRIDLTVYEQTLAQENTAIQMIQSAEKRKKCEELKKAIFADQEGAIAALPIAHIGSAPVIEG